MAMESINLSPEGMRKWVKPLGGDYAKRRKTNAILTVTDKEIVADDAYWSSGSKSSYVVVNKAGAVVRHMREVPPPPFNNGMENDRHILNDDEMVIKYGFFCGKPAMPIFYVKNKDGWQF